MYPIKVQVHKMTQIAKIFLRILNSKLVVSKAIFRRGHALRPLYMLIFKTKLGMPRPQNVML